MSNKPRLEDDFYNYINYDYFKKTKIPKGHARWASYYQLSDENKKKLKNEIFKKERNYDIKDVNLVYNYFDLILDIKSRNKTGIGHIKKLLNKIDEFSSLDELTDLFVYYFENAFEFFFFSFGVYPDAKDSNTNIVYLESDGLIMGNRDYYFDEDDQTKKINQAYFKYLKNILNIYGYKDQKIIDDTYAIEREMANLILKNEEYRDPYVSYNMTDVSKLKDKFNLWNWDVILKTINMDNQKRISIAEMKYFENLQSILSKFKFDQIKNYLLTSIIIGIGTSGLTTKIGKINFEFSKVFSGVKKPKPRKDAAYDSVEGLFGDIIGKVFVAKWFSEESKEDVSNMTKKMIQEYKTMIEESKWMSDKAKSKAITKLNTMVVKIGYPDEWKDYSKLKILTKKDGETLYSALKKISRWGFDKAIEELNKPVDKKKWFMNAQTVNAYYNPSSNEICFPAGILQPPFYNNEFSIEKKYAAIGSVIGHEISHAFDDSGCEFDEKGNLNKWWEKEDYQNYANISKGLEEQFNNYQIHGEKVNGKLTLGENIADLVGLTVALRVAKNEKKDLNGKEFFSYFAEAERVLSTKNALLSQIKSDPHSPSLFRVNGVLENINEFYEVFNIKKEDKMFREKNKRVHIL